MKNGIIFNIAFILYILLTLVVRKFYCFQLFSSLYEGVHLLGGLPICHTPIQVVSGFKWRRALINLGMLIFSFFSISFLPLHALLVLISPPIPFTGLPQFPFDPLFSTLSVLT